MARECVKITCIKLERRSAAAIEDNRSSYILFPESHTDEEKKDSCRDGVTCVVLVCPVIPAHCHPVSASIPFLESVLKSCAHAHPVCGQRFLMPVVATVVPRLLPHGKAWSVILGVCSSQ